MNHIYISASWKHQLAVELLTEWLEEKGIIVNSFVRNRHGEQKGSEPILIVNEQMTFDEWIWSNRGKLSFDFDTNSVGNARLVIYIGPSGQDTWAEIGIAWSARIKILGFYGKGENAGLMRRMIEWYHEWPDLKCAIKRELSI